jgi:hypothetical protein
MQPHFTVYVVEWPRAIEPHGCIATWSYCHVESGHMSMWPRTHFPHGHMEPRFTGHVAEWPRAREPRGHLAMWYLTTSPNGHVSYIHVIKCGNFVKNYKVFFFGPLEKIIQYFTYDIFYGLKNLYLIY